jgi:CRP/FNR family transcriptional regulator, cyclic AMP receptor protein
MPDRQIASLLELDPDLGMLLPRDRLAAAERELRVGVHVLDTGPWELERVAGTNMAHIGLLVLDGVLAREVLVSDTVSTELLGPGDVLRPWRLHESAGLLHHAVRWNVLSRSRIALLDRRFAAQLAKFPEVNAAVIDRVNERALRLTLTQAISQLNRVDRRLLALFWHLAERWGRMTSEGVALPMTLSHRMLGQLVGARRPTVSTALGELVKSGDVRRRDDGTWLLTGAPIGVPAPELERVVPMRRRLLPADAPAAERAAELAPRTAARPEPVRVNAVELRAVFQRLREVSEAQVAQMHVTVALATELTERSNALQARARATRWDFRQRDHRAMP